MSSADESKHMPDVGLILKGAVLTARILRGLHLQNVVGKLRRRACHGFFELLHRDVIHRMRRFAICIQAEAPNAEQVSERAVDFCTAGALMMGQILELEPSGMHCGLKVIVRSKGNGDCVETWARSEPFDDRSDDGPGQGQPLENNTLYASLLGRSDGRNFWKPFNCFCCNDLTKHTDEFSGKRSDWVHYYKSKLVYPVRYIPRQNLNAYETIGFLEFDSAKAGVFADMPNIFEFKNRTNDYRAALAKSTTFHVGALIADGLSMALRPYYERENEKIERPK